MLLEPHQTCCRKTLSLSWALASSLSARHAFCPPASFSTCCEYFVCASSCSRTQSKEQNRQSRRKSVATANTCCLKTLSLSRALASLSSSALCTYFSPDGAHLSTNSASQSPFACVIILVSANANTKSWVRVCGGFWVQYHTTACDIRRANYILSSSSRFSFIPRTRVLCCTTLRDLSLRPHCHRDLPAHQFFLPKK